MKSVANGISYLFHPIVFILHVPFIILYRETGDIWYSLRWNLFSSLFLIIVMIIFYLLHPEEFMTDFDIDKRENRIVFYSIGCIIAVVYFIIAVLFKGVFFPLSIISLGVILGLLTLEIANFYIKVSIHVAVICAYAVTVGFLYGVNVFLVVWWLIPIVSWARLYLRKHTLTEIFSGAIVGFLITGITFSVEKLVS